jgi:hypothetical protein
VTLHHHLAFGLHWASALPLPPFARLGHPRSPPDVTLELVEAPPAARIELARWGRSTICADGLRLLVDDVAVLDLLGDHWLEVHPGPAWRGELPVELYGTMMAVVLAARGLAPIHASAVELDGRAIVLCGPAGAGKSSVSAWLIAGGARLVSDDLSVVGLDDHGQPRLFAGRLDTRLDAPAVAMLRAAGQSWPSAGHSPLGKECVLPPCISPAAPLPLGTIVHLGPDLALDGLVEERLLKIHLLCSQLFRPQLLQRLPGHAQRHRTLAAACHLPLMRVRTSARVDDQVVAAIAERIREAARGHAG